jgi:MFS family permease
MVFVGIDLLRSLQDTSQPWRLYLFVLMYGLGYGALGPVCTAAAAALLPDRRLGMALGVPKAWYGLGGACGTYMARCFHALLGD